MLSQADALASFIVPLHAVTCRHMPSPCHLVDTETDECLRLDLTIEETLPQLEQEWDECVSWAGMG